MTEVASASIGVVPMPLAHNVEDGDTIEVGSDVLGLSTKDVETAVGVGADVHAETKLEELATRVRGSSFVEGGDKGGDVAFKEKDAEDNITASGPEATATNAAKDDAAAEITSGETGQIAIDGETHAAPEVVVDNYEVCTYGTHLPETDAAPLPQSESDLDGGERVTAADPEPEHAVQAPAEVEPKAEDEEPIVESTKADEDLPEPASVDDVVVPAKEEEPIEAEEATQLHTIEEPIQAQSEEPVEAEAPVEKEELIKVVEIEDDQASEGPTRDELPTAEETEDKPSLEVKAEAETPKEVEDSSKKAELIEADDVLPAAEEVEPATVQEPTVTEAEVTKDANLGETAEPAVAGDLVAVEDQAEQEVTAQSASEDALEIVSAVSEVEPHAPETVLDIKPESEEVVQPGVEEGEAGVLAAVDEVDVKEELADAKAYSESGIESLSSVPTETGDAPSVTPDEHATPSIPEEVIEDETAATKEPEDSHHTETVEETPQVELTAAIPADATHASLPEPVEVNESVDLQAVEPEAIIGQESIDAASSLEAQAGETEAEVPDTEEAIIDGPKPEETGEVAEPENVAAEQPIDAATSVDDTPVDVPEVKAPGDEHVLPSDSVEPEEKDDTLVPAAALTTDDTAEAPSEGVKEVIDEAPEESVVAALAEEAGDPATGGPPDVLVETVAEETPAAATNEAEEPSDEVHVKDAVPSSDEVVEPESNKEGERTSAESLEDVPVVKEMDETHARELEDESEAHEADVAPPDEEEQDASEAITEQTVHAGEVTLVDEPATADEAVAVGEATLAEDQSVTEPTEAIEVEPATEPVQQDASEPIVDETADAGEATLAEEPAAVEPAEAVEEELATEAGQQDVSETVIDDAVNVEEPAPAESEPAEINVDEATTTAVQQDVSESIIDEAADAGEATLAEEPATVEQVEAVEEEPAAEAVQQDVSESIIDDAVNVDDPEVEPAEVDVDESTTAVVQRDVSEPIIDEVVNAGESTLAVDPATAKEESATEPAQQDVSESIIGEVADTEEPALTEVEPTKPVQQDVSESIADESVDVGEAILAEAPATTEPVEEESPEEPAQEVPAIEIQAAESEEPLVEAVEASTDAEPGQVDSAEVEVPISKNAQGPLEDVVQESSPAEQAVEARLAGEEPAEAAIANSLEDSVAPQESDDKAEHATEFVQEHPSAETMEDEPQLHVAPAEEVSVEQESAVLEEPSAAGNADVADEASLPAIVAAESVDVAASVAEGPATGLQDEGETTELQVEDDRSVPDVIVTKEVQVEEQAPTGSELLEGTEQVSVAVEEPEIAQKGTDIHAEAEAETEVQIVGPDEEHPLESAEPVGEGMQDAGLLDEPIPDVQVELPTPLSETRPLAAEEDEQDTDVPLEHRLAEAIGFPAEEIAKLPAFSSLESNEVITSTFEEETTTPTESKAETVVDETLGKGETLPDESKDSEALAESDSEQPTIIETFETETNTVPEDRSTNEDATEVPERPKSPWAPSYSVTTQGSSPVHPPEEEQVAKELDVNPIESVLQSTMEPVVDNAPVLTEDIVPPPEATPLIEVQISELVREGEVHTLLEEDDVPTDEEEEAPVSVAPAPTLSVDTGVKEIPERPKSPWTPSYTVTMQGPGIPEPEELVLDTEPDLTGAVEEKGEIIQVTPPADDVSVSTQEMERPKSPYPPSYSVTQMGPGIGEENGSVNETEEVGSVVSSNDPEAPSTPRSELGVITPGFDSRSEVSEASDVSIPPSSPRSDPEVTSLAEREVKTPLVLGAEERGTPISPLHTPLLSASKTLEDESEDEPEVAGPLTESAVSGFNGDGNANQTTVTGSWIKATDVERDTQVPESEAPLSEDGADETVIQSPEPSKETKPSVTTIPRLDITTAPPISQPIIVTNSLSTDSAYTQLSDSLSPSQETGTNVTTPDVDNFSISKGDTFAGSDVESIEPLDEETVSHFSDRTRTPTGPEVGGKSLGVAHTLAMRSFPSAFGNNGLDKLASADQSKQVPAIESLEANDQLSPLSSRRRLESTVSSLAFPGGWVATPPQKERPSLEFATGEFSRPIIDGTPVSPAVTPTAVAEASSEKESKWRCIIM